MNTIETKIVRGLIRWMRSRDFAIHGIWDGETYTRAPNEKQAIEVLNNLDEASLRFQKVGFGEHGVLLVMGNGEDIISDWNYRDGDPDGFNAAMDAYMDSPTFLNACGC